MMKSRSYEKEWMDELDSSGEVIVQTLKELDYINRKLGGNNISIQGIAKLLKHSGKTSFSLADLGCGGGDILKEIAKWGRKRNMEMQLVGIDANPNIILYAENNCKDFPEISFQTVDIFSDDFVKQKFDIYHASLFTHHFDEAALVKMLGTCYKNSTAGIIINDLQRHWFAYYAIKWLTKVFSKSPMVQNDACVSVKRGFHKTELVDIMKQANIESFDIVWKWAFRWKVIGFRPMH